MLFTEDESLSNYWQWTVETEQLALSDTNILLSTNWYYNNNNRPLVQHQICQDILSCETWKHKEPHPLIAPFYFPFLGDYQDNNLSLIIRFSHINTEGSRKVSIFSKWKKRLLTLSILSSIPTETNKVLWIIYVTIVTCDTLTSCDTMTSCDSMTSCPE